MSIINQSTPIELTTDQKKAKAKARLLGSSNQLFRQMLSTFNNNMAVVWSNEDGLTPQDIFDAFGTDAGEMVRLAGVLKDAINNAVAGTITADTPKTLTTNQDGTVTVGS